MKVKAIKCPRCGDTIYSRARHDFHSCSCRAIHIDGGFAYLRYGWLSIIKRPVSFNFEVPNGKLHDTEFKRLMYDDWNFQYNKYGRIKGCRREYFRWLRKRVK